MRRVARGVGRSLDPRIGAGRGRDAVAGGQLPEQLVVDQAFPRGVERGGGGNAVLEHGHLIGGEVAGDDPSGDERAALLDEQGQDGNPTPQRLAADGGR